MQSLNFLNLFLITIYLKKLDLYLIVLCTSMLNKILRDFAFDFSSGVISIGVSLGHAGFRIKSVNIVSLNKELKVLMNIETLNIITICLYS